VGTVLKQLLLRQRALDIAVNSVRNICMMDGGVDLSIGLAWMDTAAWYGGLWAYAFAGVGTETP